MQASVQQVYDQLGGESAVGAVIHSESEMEAALRRGLPFSVLGVLRGNWNLTVVELAASLAIPKSTLMRLLTTKQKRMATGQSDRAYRLASILALAEEAIGDRTKAQLWLKQPNQALGSVTPLHALETEIGSRRVEQVLGRIAYGGVS
jgi:putative toxin-antitoxin system antitoxin component (TIGR02293 family)